jgi:hypothetical protein
VATKPVEDISRFKVLLLFGYEKDFITPEQKWRKLRIKNVTTNYDEYDSQQNTKSNAQHVSLIDMT